MPQIQGVYQTKTDIPRAALVRKIQEPVVGTGTRTCAYPPMLYPQFYHLPEVIQTQLVEPNIAGMEEREVMVFGKPSKRYFIWYVGQRKPRIYGRGGNRIV